MAEIRDPDLTAIIAALRDGLAELKANVISRWGRVPHVGADPASPPDGALWIRSDTGNLMRRANGVNHPAAWTAVTYQNGWSNLGAGWQVMQYRMDGDRVFVRGVMQAGTLTSVAFTLPVGFRPPASERFDVSNSVDTLPFVVVANTGTVTTGGLTSNVTVALEFSLSTLA